MLALAMMIAASLSLPAPAGAADGQRARPPHGAASVGWLVALTGPLPVGLAAEAEFFPGGPFGRHGLGVYYRSDLAGERGMITGGLVFEAGATRPKLVMSLHADVGATYGPAHPALGVGARAQLAVLGPLVIAGNATGHVIVAGVDSRLALALTLTAGVSR